MQSSKVSAPLQGAQMVTQETKATGESDCTASRKELLAFRGFVHMKKSQPNEMSGLRTICMPADSEVSTTTLKQVQPNKASGVRKVSVPSDSEVSTTTSDRDTSKHDEPSNDCPSAYPEEYQVLLKNLPTSLMQAATLKGMIKDAHITDVKKLVFSSDGKALVILTSYKALCQCVNHFDGWCTCIVSPMGPSKVKTSAQLSAQAPVFVPGSTQYTSKISSAAKASDKARRDKSTDSLESIETTDSGASHDEASLSDSEMESLLPSQLLVDMDE